MNNPAITILPTIPTASSLTPLSEHQASTPLTFFGAKPVLHASFSNADVLLSTRDIKSWAQWREVFGAAPSTRHSGGGTNGTNGHVSTVAEDEEEEVEADTIENKRVYTGVSGFITSESLILFDTPPAPPHPTPASSAQGKAISIPYPSISLHATQRIHTSSEHTYISSAREEGMTQPEAQAQKQALYLQLDLGDPFTRNPADDEDEGETVEVLIVPYESSIATTSTTSNPDTNATSTTITTATDPGATETQQTQASLVSHLFASLSRCADLHPDPNNPDSDEDMGGAGFGAGGGSGGLAGLLAGGGMPGAGGWITSENVHEFEARFGGGVDGEGGLDGEDGEGEGEEDGVDVDGEGGVTEGAELGPGAGTRRTRDEDRDEDETKWQRTG